MVEVIITMLFQLEFFQKRELMIREIVCIRAIRVIKVK